MTAAELKARRTELGLTQEQLAQALGVSWSTIARWETGSRAIPNFLALALDSLKRQQQKPV